MRPELILPGGDLERVKIAFAYGADAVYVGINKHSLRKAEVRFDVTEVGEAIKFAHSIGKRLFVTFNIFAHNHQLDTIAKDMKAIAAFSPDAFIMADLGVINLAKQVAPNVPIHVSTQANTVNIEDVKFWRDYGAKRVVLARELSLAEIKQIHDAVPDIELEAFVHGSMCISYSGRCLMSNYMTGRDANNGECAQPCRWNYNVYLEEKNRPGEYFPAEETEAGTNIMSSRDLAAIEILPEILDAGVMGLKVEGRNKSEYYLATVGHAYKQALKAIEHNNYTKKLKTELLEELQKVNNREYTTGFYLGDAKSGETYEGRAPIRKWDYVGQFIDDKGTLIVKNKISLGDKIEVLTPDKIYTDKVVAITDLTGKSLDEINPGKNDQQAVIILSKNYSPHTFVRKQI